MEHFTVLIQTGPMKDHVEIFEANDFPDAINIVVAKFPDITYRLYLGKGVPERKIEQPIPPTLPKPQKA